MGTPQSVLDQAARADEILKANAPQPKVEGAPQAQPTPAQAGTPAPAADVNELQRKLDEEQHRYSVLRGRFQAEVKRQVEEATKPLMAEIESLKAGGKPAPSGLPPGVTEEELNLYGKPLIDLVSKVAKASGPEKPAAPAAPKAPEIPEPTAEDIYFSKLEKLIPNFWVKNEEPGFLKWLDGKDPATGRVRMDILQDANKAMLEHRVAEIFKAYAESREIGAAATIHNFEPGGPGGGGIPPNPTQVKIWTRAEIAQFYREMREGVYRGKEAEAAALEKDIFAAQREGRVT